MSFYGDDLSRKAGKAISRRTVVKAAAWTAPAVVIATASPAAANASGTMSITSITGVRSGIGGVGPVNFTATFTGTSNGTHTATIEFPQLNLGIVGLANFAPDKPTATRSNAGTAAFQTQLKLVAGLVPTRPPNTVTVSVSIPGHQAATALVASISG